MKRPCSAWPIVGRGPLPFVAWRGRGRDHTKKQKHESTRARARARGYRLGGLLKIA